MGPRNESGVFSGGGSRFCSVGGGSARVWNCSGGGARAPKHEVVPDAHLASPLRPGAVAWLRLHSDGTEFADRTSQTLPKSRKRKSSRNSEENHSDDIESSHIAFGTSSGKILIYSLALGQIESILEDDKADRQDKNIACIDWNSSCGLYSCSSNSTVKEWSIENNTILSKFNMNSYLKTPNAASTTIIRLITDKWSNSSKQKFMLVAACQLQFWCLSTKTLLKTMIGHADSVCLLDIIYFPGDNRLYAVSGSKGDRILSFWSINSSQDMNKMNGDGSETGELDVPKSKKKIKKGSLFKSEAESIINPSCNFLMEDIPQQIYCKTMNGERSIIKLTAVTRSGVVHYYEFTLNGVITKPVKPNVTLQIASNDKDGSVKPIPVICSMLYNNSILLGYTLGLGMVFEYVEPNVNEKVQVIVRENKDISTKKKESEKQLTESITKIKHTDDNSSVVYLSSALGRTDNSFGSKRSASGQAIDVPMESRLANLSLTSAGNKPGTMNKNMTQLLVQGLHSKDSKLLQSVFECADKDIAENTLNNLPVQYLSSLMDHLIEMLAGKTNKCRSACVWAEALCKTKSSALLSLGFAESSKISDLRSALAARVPSLSALIGLRARLVLTLHRMTDSTNTPMSQEPLIDYIDASSEDEMGDEMDEALINNVEDDSASWNEEDDLDEDNENDAENSSNQSDEDMSGSDNESVVSE